MNWQGPASLNDELKHIRSQYPVNMIRAHDIRRPPLFGENMNTPKWDSQRNLQIGIFALPVRKIPSLSAIRKHE